MSEDLAVITMAVLNRMSARDAPAVAWAAYDYLQDNAAGLPYVALIEDNARSDARFWAETATPAELECYALAACDKLSASHLFTSRQIKRLAGALFRRMSPVEQAAFSGWIKGQTT